MATELNGGALDTIELRGQIKYLEDALHLEETRVVNCVRCATPNIELKVSDAQIYLANMRLIAARLTFLQEELRRREKR
jgi:hypothetical protein